MARLLLVDNNALNLELLADLLEADGHEIVAVENGFDAFEVALSKWPDVMLLDLAMPGMDGLSLLRKVKTTVEIQEMPVIMVTAHAFPADRAICFEAGCSAYITKPIDGRDLVREVRKFCPS